MSLDPVSLSAAANLERWQPGGHAEPATVRRAFRESRSLFIIAGTPGSGRKSSNRRLNMFHTQFKIESSGSSIPLKDRDPRLERVGVEIGIAMSRRARSANAAISGITVLRRTAMRPAARSAASCENRLYTLVHCLPEVRPADWTQQCIHAETKTPYPDITELTARAVLGE
jgi:hypothetical protein